ncbi:MAG: cell division FtsA domain-containing protein [Porphyromonadaceae bacterium]|nr:cell division FtsA domain-containing protein [Porphyromonadaceae bacterium]
MNTKKEKTYVTINLGSSYITGIAAYKLSGGRISPIAISRKPSNRSILHGAIHNVDEAARIIGQILDDLGQKLPEREIIKSVYVGLECRSMQSRVYHTSLSLSEEGEIITLDHLQTLADQARDARYPGMEILRISDPRYYVDGKQEGSPQGVRCSRLEANFQIIIARRSIVANIHETFENKLGLKIHEILIAPQAEAVITLRPEETMLGCAYINIGGGCTSVSIYENRLLSALHILPFGGINVTKDLTHLHLIEADAERLKVEYGSMDLSIAKDEVIKAISTSGSPDKQLNRYELNRYVSARMTEIMSNVMHIIQLSGYEEQIKSGLVISGGATNIDHFFHFDDKLPIRQGRARRELISEAVADADLKLYQTELGLIYQAKEDCVDQEYNSLENLFDESEEKPISETKSLEQEDDEAANSVESAYTFAATDEVAQDDDYESVEVQEKPRGKGFFSRWGDMLRSTLNQLNGTDEDE